jgi:sulfate adenylyltransferase (ADP) / ATP adenylyltransferase
VPFAYFSRKLKADPKEHEIHQAYLELLHESTESWKKQRPLRGRDESTSCGFSYNLGMTVNAIVLCPRVSEGVPLKGGNDEELGAVALNGTMLAGTLMVKREDTWEYLKDSRHAGLDVVLKGVGLERSQGMEKGANI